MRRQSLAAVWAAAGLMVGCGQLTADDAVDPGGAPPAGPLTAADVAAIGSCAQLHDAVLARIDRQSAAAGSIGDSGLGGDALGELELPDLAARSFPPTPTVGWEARRS